MSLTDPIDSIVDLLWEVKQGKLHPNKAFKQLLPALQEKPLTPRENVSKGAFLVNKIYEIKDEKNLYGQKVLENINGSTYIRTDAIVKIINQVEWREVE